MQLLDHHSGSLFLWRGGKSGGGINFFLRVLLRKRPISGPSWHGHLQDPQSLQMALITCQSCLLLLFTEGFCYITSFIQLYAFLFPFWLDQNTLNGKEGEKGDAECQPCRDRPLGYRNRNNKSKKLAFTEDT